MIVILPFLLLLLLLVVIGPFGDCLCAARVPDGRQLTLHFALGEKLLETVILRHYSTPTGPIVGWDKALFGISIDILGVEIAVYYFCRPVSRVGCAWPDEAGRLVVGGRDTT